MKKIQENNLVCVAGKGMAVVRNIDGIGINKNLDINNNTVYGGVFSRHEIADGMIMPIHASGCHLSSYKHSNDRRTYHLGTTIMGQSLEYRLPERQLFEIDKGERLVGRFAFVHELQNVILKLTGRGFLISFT